MSVGHILNSNNDKLNVICYYRLYLAIVMGQYTSLTFWCYSGNVHVYRRCYLQCTFLLFFLLKQYHRWILMDVFVKKSQTHVDLLSVKQFQNLWHWCKNKAFTIHRSKREGLHFLSIKSPRYKANLFTPYQLATSAAKKRDKMPDIFCSLKLF